MKKPTTSKKPVQKATWVLCSGIALNTVLRSSLADCAETSEDFGGVSMTKPKTSEKLIQNVKWVLYSGIAVNTMLLIAALAEGPKAPRSIGE